jgi:NADH dehydrogenase
MAVIGRHAAVVNLGRLKFGGFPAWLTWIFIHIAYLIEFDNKLVVLVRWAWNYLTKKKGARLITNRVE